MTNRLLLLCFSASLLLASSIPNHSYAQSFNGIPTPFQAMTLDQTFSAYEVFTMDVQPMASYVQNHAEANLNLSIGAHAFSFSLTPSNLLSENYFLQVEHPDGNQIIYHRPNILFKGYETSGGKVRLTLDKNYIHGAIQQEDQIWYIEPLRDYVQDAPEDMFVLYERKAVLPNPNATCGVTEEMEQAAKLEKDHDEVNGTADQVAVYELELAIAADQLMLAKYGSNSGVETHIFSILNLSEADYTGSFNHDLCFDVVTTFIATSFPGPWTGSNDAGTLLNSFANWGQGGGFGVPFDIGEMWTNRDFNGGTVGIAFLNGVCNSAKYNCIQDWTTNDDLLRCTVSHEIGHNFSSVHDVCSSGTFIMCPFVSNSTTWSSQSQNSINNYMQTRINNGCLGACVQGPPLVAGFTWQPEPGCVGQPVQFTDQSTGNITARSWSFPGGTPSTSTAVNPVVTFNTPGTKQVTLTITGNGGATNSTQETVTIDPLPIANFSYVVDDLTLTFTNLSQNATSYLWEFGDGGESTESDPVYTYVEAGTYVVKLHATSHCGTVTKSFTINTFPAANFSAEPTNGCASLLVQLVNESSTNSTSFQWSFPGGIPTASNLANPIVLYTLPGVYSITLTAFNSAGSSTFTQTNYITVTTTPAPGFNFSANGLTVSFTNTSINGTSYLWNFGDGNTSTMVNPVHTYAVSDTFVVSLTATNICGSVTVTKTVIIAPPPVAGFTLSSDNGCAPLTVNLTNTSTGATSYAWSFPGGSPATSTDANPTVEYDTSGVYVVTLTAISNSGTATATDTITVNTIPGVSFTSQVNGVIVNFTNGTTNGSSYAWNFGDGATSTEVNPSHTYAEDGVYTVTLTATNACGTSTTTQTVTIVTPPIADFSAGPLSGCASLIVQFTNGSSDNATNFEWLFPGGSPSSSNAQNPTVVYNTPGIYAVTLIASNGAGTDTITYPNLINVNSAPQSSFTSSLNGAVVSFTNTSTNADSYAWDFGDGSTSTATNPVHTYSTDGIYTVVLSATNACGTVTSTQTVTVVTPPTASFNAAPTSGCVPTTVQFNNTSSNNSVSFEWQFPGGSPASSSETNPSVTYNLPGVYSVILTATNSAGTSTATQTDYITIGTAPTAGFNSSVDQGTVTFTNTSTNGDSYAWDFGDGTISTEQNPVHEYLSDGTYTVVLSVTNACGTSTFSQSVVIITEPDAGFTATTTSGCGPLQVSFVNLSSDNTTSWEWTFEGGIPSTSTDQNPTVIYLNPGSYDVTLIATGPGGSSTFIQTDFINVFGPPVGGFNFNQNQNSVSFSNTSTDATSYLWNFGDGSTSTEANPTHTYTQDGVYTVILAATNNCGTTIVEQTVTIVTAPIAAFTFNSSVGCAPFSVTFNNTSSDNATAFAWTFDGGSPASSNVENPTTTWNTPGVYLVTLTASNSAGSSTATATITVSTTPVADFNAQTAGLSVVFTNSSQNGNSYLWNFGDGGSSTEANPTHTYAATGTYTVTLTATNSCGSTTTTQTVTIAGSAPIPAFSANLTDGCAGFTIQFTDESVGEPNSWNWVFEGGSPSSSTDQNPSVTYNTPGTYDVSLDVSNIYGTSSTTIQGYITITGLPVAGFDYATNNGTVSFSNTSQGGSSYAWDFGDGTSSTEANPTHTYAGSGTYTVSLTVTNNCGASTLQQSVIVIVVGTTELNWIDSFKLFPNPNDGQFTIELAGKPFASVEMALFNQLGENIRSEIVDFSAGVLTKQFDYQNLPSAVYTLRITAGHEAKHVKVVIQK